jgi:hypothetical protein
MNVFVSTAFPHFLAHLAVRVPSHCKRFLCGQYGLRTSIRTGCR